MLPSRRRHLSIARMVSFVNVPIKVVRIKAAIMTIILALPRDESHYVSASPAG